MPPPVILDPTGLDFDRPIARRAEIERVLPQRHEFQLLDAVVMIDQERMLFAGYRDILADDWWARGHIPGRPLYPGVLMIETAAQLSAYVHHAVRGTADFMGFAGVDEVKYRGTVQPPCRFVVVGRARDIRPRRLITEVQGFVNGTMVFEAVIVGMVV